ncbi:hypothetical protein A4X13_0g4493 [Tilletia indica]|uniref:Uncharacterized protein n=1 Tax=Tilletia indica TaxID=43049 RepID=A0A177T7U7_9BASI|nr:hypothetical protein A4X13_0g4493 [Tilletia indica]
MAWSLTKIALLAPLGLIALVFLGISIFIGNLLVGIFYRYLVGEYFNNPVGHIPKVKHTGSILSTIFMGDFAAIKAAAPAAQHIEWMAELGPVYRYRHAFFVQRVLLADPKAMLWLTTQQNSYKFPKPEHTSAFLAAMIGHGLVASDGDAHKRQRRVLAPAFSPACVRELQPSMDMHGARLVHKLRALIKFCDDRRSADAKINSSASDPSTAFKAHTSTNMAGETAEDRAHTVKLPAGSAVIDVLFWGSRAALDVIGDVGFKYNFDALNKGHADPVADACNKTVAACMEVDLVQALTIILSENKGFKWLRKIPTKANRSLKHSRQVTQVEARRIVAKGKAEVQAEMAQMGTTDKSAFDEGSIAGLGSSKSIFNRMIRANMATDVKESERLSDHELEEQLITLILAGHETSATGLSWGLDLMAKNPAAQEKLRKELQEALREEEDVEEEEKAEADGVGNGNGYSNTGGNYTCPLPSKTRGKLNFKDIHALPYLDAVMKEVIRLAPSITSTVRQATEDAVIPLSKAYPKAGKAGKKGETFDSVFIPKGAEIFIPIQVIQASPEIWGEDALDFKPERWFNVPQSAQDTQLPNQLFAFLTGPRSCIGQRMAVSEMKILLAHVVLNFKMECVPGYEFDARQRIVTRAFVKGQEEYGTRMPLIFTPV